MRLKLSLTLTLSVLCALCEPAVAVAQDSLKLNLVQRVIKYFDESNKPKAPKKFDFSFIGGPYYASDTKLGIGVVAAGLYRRNLADTINPGGQVNIYGDFSITGFYKVGIRGTQMFHDGNHELTYDVSFESRPDRFWGIGYDMACQDSNRTDYKRRRISLDATYLMRVFPHFMMGPRVLIDRVSGYNIKRPELWPDQRRQTFTDGVGVALMYDTRDNVYNASRGFYARIDQMFAPKFMGNRYPFTMTELAVCWFTPTWRDCVLATRFHTRLTYGDTPWGLMSTLGGSYNMRGYWEGRYNDKCAADLTLELRQHLWRRIGMVVWGGYGEVFPKFKDFFNSRLLYNYGLGLRWEFKKKVNVRVDYGFGFHQQGLVFSINEAF